MHDNTIAEIDLDQIVRARAGKKSKYIPNWLIGALKRLIHQDFINEFLRRGYIGVDFCEECIRYLDVTVKVKGLENLSDDSRKYTFVSNHPLGAIDGVALGMILGRKFNGNVKYLVNKYLNERNDLVELIMQDSDSVKYILSEISKGKKRDYDKEDIDLIKDISFYYL